MHYIHTKIIVVTFSAVQIKIISLKCLGNIMA